MNEKFGYMVVNNEDENSLVENSCMKEVSEENEKEKWKKLHGDLYRFKTDGGWLVGIFSQNSSRSHNNEVSLADASCSICFIPDSKYSWKYSKDGWKSMDGVKHHRIQKLDVPGGFLIRSIYKPAAASVKYLCAGELVFVKK